MLISEIEIGNDVVWGGHVYKAVGKLMQRSPPLVSLQRPSGGAIFNVDPTIHVDPVEDLNEAVGEE